MIVSLCHGIVPNMLDLLFRRLPKSFLGPRKVSYRKNNVPQILVI
jgi:hypothetical protein